MRHLAIFLCTVAAWIIVILNGSRPLVNLTQPPNIDFKSFQADERLIFRRVPNHERDALKLAALQASPSACIGIFGDHTARFATADAFQLTPFTGFFNFSFGTLTLPEIRDILRYAAQKARLPKVVIVQIESPRIHSGNLLINYRTPLPWPIMATSPEQWWSTKRIASAFTYASIYLRNRLDWAQLLSSLSASHSEGDYIVLHPQQCANPERHFASAPTQPWQRLLPTAIRDRIVRDARSTAISVCAAGDLSGIGGDGSLVGLPKRSPTNLHNWPTAGLQPEDGRRIAETLMEIKAIVNAADSELIALAAPVYAQNHDVPLNAVLSQALASLSGVVVIDKRFGVEANDLTYFYDDDEHPNDRFYAVLAGDLRAISPAYRSCLESHKSHLSPALR